MIEFIFSADADVILFGGLLSLGHIAHLFTSNIIIIKESRVCAILLKIDLDPRL